MEEVGCGEDGRWGRAEKQCQRESHTYSKRFFCWISDVLERQQKKLFCSRGLWFFARLLSQMIVESPNFNLTNNSGVACDLPWPPESSDLVPWPPPPPEENRTGIEPGNKVAFV